VVWIVAPDHPWARAGSYGVEELESQNYICSSTASYTSILLEKYFEREGIRLKSKLEVGSLEIIKEMVKDGAGIAALATWAVRNELREKSLVAVPLGKRKLKRNWCAMRSLDRKPDLAHETFVKISLEATKALHSLCAVATMLMNDLWQTGLFDQNISDIFPVQV
jgi:DNA-binding transcriptional LysR family regulator